MSSTNTDATIRLSNSPSEVAGKYRLVISPGEDSERTVELKSSVVRLGKSEEADVRLEDPHVSRLHAQLTIDAEGVQLVDLNSVNGTHVNGVPVTKALLTTGAVLKLGRTTIRLEVDVPVGPGADRFGEAVGSSTSMREVFALLRKISKSDLNVVLLGETGCGKDVLARSLHAESARSSKPFEVFDCGAVSANLIESELFGHVKGSFTGAHADRAGAFERAHGGTLFLDEVGELPLELQPRLLRALEQRRVRRVGGGREIDIDVRVVSATNRDLDKEVANDAFRRDLWFRLNQAVVQVPPLRDRPEDIGDLVRAALDELSRTDLSLAPETLSALRSYEWPGNVRELKNVVATAAAFCEGAVLEPRHLMLFKRRPDPTLEDLPLGGRTLQRLEEAAIKQTLEQFGGNKTKTAAALGIATSTLYEKLKKLGL